MMNANAVLHRPGDEKRGEVVTIPCKAVSAEELPRRLRRGRESFVLAGIDHGVAHYRQVSA